MSGPWSYGYAIVEDPAVVAARQEAAALALARGRVESALGRLQVIAAEADGLRRRHGARITEIPVPEDQTQATSAATDRVAQELEQTATRAEERLRREAGEARTASFMLTLRGGVGSATDESDASLERLIAAAAARAAPGGEIADKSDITQAQGSHSAEALAEDCARIFGRLHTDASEEARGLAERTLQAALAATQEERGPFLVDRLRSAVVAANTDAEARDERTREIDDLLAGLGDLPAPDATRLRSLLMAERTEGREVAALAAQVERARAEAQQQFEDGRRAAERTRVGEALKGAFSDLGYEVQGEFEIALTGRQPALVRRSGWTDHAVRVLVDERSGRLGLHVVEDERLPVSTAAETACQELESDRVALEQALASHGVRIEAQELRPPGTVPVARIPLTQVDFEHRIAARRSPQERSL